MTSTDLSVVEVTQADRDAAIPFVGTDYTKRNGMSDGYWIGTGQYDNHPLVQAFARHLIADTRTPSPETTRVLVEAQRIVRDFQTVADATFLSTKSRIEAGQPDLEMALAVALGMAHQARDILTAIGERA